MLLFVTVTHTSTGITNPEGSVSIIYGQSDGARVVISIAHQGWLALETCQPI